MKFVYKNNEFCAVMRLNSHSMCHLATTRSDHNKKAHKNAQSNMKPTHRMNSILDIDHKSRNDSHNNSHRHKESMNMCIYPRIFEEEAP